MVGPAEPETEAQIVKSEIHIEPRPGDNVIDARELRQFDLFRRMKKIVNIEKFPGSIILRKFSKGDVLFQQGQPGGTAFYIPTAADLIRMQALEEGKEPPDNPAVDPNRDLHVLSALIIPATTKPRPRGILSRLFGSRDKSKTGTSKFAAIPNDGPAAIDFKTREAPLSEGNLFGEMSCISFMPRSATVVARRDCQILEFNRNVFDQIRGDKNHQAVVEEEYRRRTLDTHLRQFELFKGLNDSQIQLLKDNVTLEVVPPGNVICEEGERWSDEHPLDVFIVRNGVVQVIVNANISVTVDDIRDWSGFCRLVDEAKADPKVIAPPAPAIAKAAVPGAAAKPPSPLDAMRQKKASEAASGDAPKPAAPPAGPTSGKPSPLDLIRAKQAAAKGAEAGIPAAVITDRPQPAADQSASPASESPKLSPMEQIRAKQAAAAAAKAKAEGAGAAEVTAEAASPPVAAESAPKLSPMEQIRAKQAAAAAAKAKVEGAGAPEPTAEAASAPAAAESAPKLSPMEQIRAKQAAAAAAKAKAEGTGATEATAEAASPSVAGESVPKLSPMEQIRAKQAAAAAAKAKAEGSGRAPAATEGTSPSEGASASSGKLSPMEQIRAKQAAAAAANAENDGVGAPAAGSAAAPSAAEGAPPKKPSPLDMLKPKAGAQPAVPKEAAASSGNATSAPAVSLIRKPTGETNGPPAFVVKSWLSDSILGTIHQIAQGELRDEALTAAQIRIVKALNELLQNRDFLADKRIVADIYARPAILRKSASFPKGFKGIAKEWSEMELRSTGRVAMSEIFPGMVRRPTEASGPPRVLAYLSRGECIGEIAVARGTERLATCIAYNHPSSENPRDFGNVELVRIRGTAFRKLMSESPELDRQVKSLAEKRVKLTAAAEQQSTETDLIASTEFQQMGLFQGSRLLVIDLDKCTRCGDCVEACVETHDDGASRLFLDGPRYDRFLVPSACRNCLNPVCMIGCPVGSIGRGDNGQIEIYDWCIGCAACADQCPYDSIQMHDTGLIQEESSGWLYANRRSLQTDWYRERRLSAGWMQGSSPFRWQGEFLRQWATEEFTASKEQPLHLCFRHEFRIPKKSRSQRYRLSVNDARRKGAIEKMRIKTSKIVGVWLNGEQLSLSGNSVELKSDQLSQASNILAIEVALEPPAEYGQFVLSACLDAISEVGTQALEVLGKDVRSEMDLVTRRAAVCDLCSHLPSQQPACVNSCPHDAAIRVNPMINFPM